MKITKADKFFSLCVRERANWCCEKCGKIYEPTYGENTGLPGNPALHCSHYFGRGIYETRFYPDNAFSHCYGCHSRFEQNPDKFRDWVFSRLGARRYDGLRKVAEDIMLGKEARRGDKNGTIAKHYENEFRKLREKRDRGFVKRIEFKNWKEG